MSKHWIRSTWQFHDFFGDSIDCSYPIQLELRDTTDTARSASYLDIHLKIDSEGWLITKRYNKIHDFNFPIVNFPFICSNIPEALSYLLHISQLMPYSRACCSYHDFLDRGLLLTRKLLNQGFPVVKLKSSLWTFTVATMTWLLLHNVWVPNDHVLFVVMTIPSFPHSWFIRFYIKTGVTSGAGSAYPSEAHKFTDTPGFLWGFMLLNLSFSD